MEQLLKKYFPYESHFVTIAGHQMHYIDEGEGPVVVLLHGNPTWSFYYRNLIENLKTDHRVIAPDFIGLGLSDHPKDSHFRAANRIEHIQEFVDTLKLEKFSLVMHDWGGSIGTGVAARNLDRIERLVYLNTTLTVTESLPKLIKTAASPLIGKFLTMHTKRFLKFTTELGVAKKLPKEIKKCYFLPYKTRSRRAAIWDFVADIPFESTHASYADMLDLASRIGDLSNIPVQIIWGLKDPCFHREMLNNVAALFPQARVLEIPDASHLVLEDAPELAISTIRQFLELDYNNAMQPTSSAVAEEESSEGENAMYAAFRDAANNSPYSFAAIAPSFLIDSVKYTQVNYKDLKQLINKYQRGLSGLGLVPGDKVLMLVSPGVDFLALSYAVMGRGAIPVFLDPGMGLDKLIKCIDDLQPDVFIGSIKAYVLKLIKRRHFKNLKFKVVAAEWFIGNAYSLSYLKKFAAQSLPPVKTENPVLVAYTSGATGVPKGVVFTNEMVNEQLHVFQKEFGLEAGKKDLPLLPIFSLYNLSLGVTSVFPPINPAKPLDLEPQKIVQIISDLGIDYSFGSPTLWKKIGEYCVRSRKPLVSIKKIFMAGAPVPKETIEMLHQNLPNGETFTPYGATEALPVTLVSGNDIVNLTPKAAKTGEQGTFVGKPLASIELKIIKQLKDPVHEISKVAELKDFEIGEVIVKGKNISKEYFNLPEANAKSKIADGDDAWHCVGDMAYLDSDNNLYFCGRKAHIVETKDRVYYSDPVERIFNLHEKVNRSALVELSNGEPAIVIEPHPQFWPESSEQKRSFVKELKELGLSDAISRDITRFFFHASFPVDGRHNAKIFRDQLGFWASEQEEQLKVA